MNGILANALAGMTAATRMTEAVAERRAAQPGGGLDQLVQDTVELTSARIQYAANVAVVRTADEMMGTLLDMFA